MPDALHPLARRVIRHVVAAGATVDPIEQFGDIAELHRLANSINSPPIFERIELLDRPLHVGPVRLRRLSYGAMEWLAEGPVKWFSSEEKTIANLCTAYAMAHGRSNQLCGLFNRQRTERTVKRWARELPVSLLSIYEAVDELMRRPNEAPAKAPPEIRAAAAESPLFFAVMRRHGGTLDYWIWEVPFDVVLGLIEDMNQELDAKARASVAQSGRVSAPNPHSHAVRAQKAFNDFAHDFKTRMLAQVKSQGTEMPTPAT